MSHETHILSFQIELLYVARTRRPSANLRVSPMHARNITRGLFGLHEAQWWISLSVSPLPRRSDKDEEQLYI